MIVTGPARIASLGAAAALLALALGGARAAAGPARLVQVARVPARTVEAPTLSGPDVLWGEDRSDGSIWIRAARVGGAVRTLFRAPRPAVPDDAETDRSFRVSVAQVVGAIAASPSRSAFIRDATLVKEPRCRPECEAPTLLEPLFSEVWSRASGGAFRRIAGGQPIRKGPACRRIRPTAVDVFGSKLLYAERIERCRGEAEATLVESRLVLVSGRSRPRVLLRSAAPLGPVAIAGRFAAWGRDVRSEPGFRLDRQAKIVVYDLKDRRVLYRVTADALRSDGSLTFDLQQNGTMALAAVKRASGCPPTTVAWTSRAAPRPHILPVGATGTYLRIVGNRILLSEPGPRCGNGARLALVDLRGRARTLASFSPPAFLNPEVDFDGRRLAIAVIQQKGSAATTAIYVGEATPD